LLHQVRGLGSLIPNQEFARQIPAETEATVLRIRMLPWSQLKADTIPVEISNWQVEQAAVDAQLRLKAAGQMPERQSEAAEGADEPESRCRYRAFRLNAC